MTADTPQAPGAASTGRAAELLWGERPRPRRGPKPALNPTAIARAGIEIADADGLSGLSMQRVAERLGFTKMSLYRHVPGKDELIALMVEVGVGTPPDLTAVPGGWRPKLTHWAGQMCERFRRHPWSMQATVGRRVIGPNELGWLEQAVAALADTGLSGAEMFDVAATLIGHVRSIVQQGAATPEPEQAMEPALRALLIGREDRFPAVAAALDSAAEHGEQDQALDFGLDRILDGVELHLSRTGGQPQRRSAHAEECRGEPVSRRT